MHQGLPVGPALGQGLQNSGQAHPGRCINPAGPSKLRLRMKSASDKMKSSSRKPVEAPKRASALQHGSTRGAPSLKVVHGLAHNDRETKKCGVSGRTMLHGACMTVRRRQAGSKKKGFQNGVRKEGAWQAWCDYMLFPRRPDWFTVAPYAIVHLRLEVVSQSCETGFHFSHYQGV